MRTRSAFAILAFFLLFTGHRADARALKTERARIDQPRFGATDNPLVAERQGGLAAMSAPETTWLHSASFDSGAQCTAMGWTSVDLTT